MTGWRDSFCLDYVIEAACACICLQTKTEVLIISNKIIYQSMHCFTELKVKFSY